MDDLPFFTNTEGWPSPYQPFDPSTNPGLNEIYAQPPSNSSQQYHGDDHLASTLEKASESAQDTYDAKIPCRVSDTEWEAVKDIIYNHYIINNRTLDETRSLIWSKYNFRASESQYSRRLKSWGFKKNQGNTDWLGVSHALKRRRVDVDSADIVLNGVHISSKRLRKEISRRHRPVLREKFAGYLNEPVSSSPKSPTGLILRQQNSYSIIVSPPRSLPWFDFLDRFTNVFENLTRSSASPISGGPELLKSHDRQSFMTYIFDTNDPIPDFYQHVISPYTSRQLTHCLLPMMVERTAGDLEDAMCNISMSRDSSRVLILVTAYLVYICANNLDYYIALRKWVEVMERTEFAFFLNFITGTHTPSSQIFLNCLFSFAIRTQNAWLLQQVARKVSHIDARLVDYEGQMVSGLHFTLAIRSKNLIVVFDGREEIAKLLLSLGADPSQCCCERHHTGDQIHCIRPIDIAAKKAISIDFVDDLLESGGIFDKVGILLSVIRAGGSFELIQRLVSCGASTEAFVFWHSPTFPELKSPLLAAIAAGRLEIVKMLICEGHCSPQVQEDRAWADLRTFDGIFEPGFHFKSPLACSIARGGRTGTRIFKFLLNAGADVNDCYCNYVHITSQYAGLECLSGLLGCCRLKDVTILKLGNPLQIATSYNDYGMVYKLIKKGANLEPCHGPPALFLSVANSNHSITELLLVYGANPNSSVTQEPGLTSLVIAVAKDDIRIVKLLLMHGARTTVDVISDQGYRDLVHLYLAQNIQRLESSTLGLNIDDWKATEIRCRHEFRLHSLNHAKEPRKPETHRFGPSLSLQEIFENSLLLISGASILEICLKAGACPSALSGGDHSAVLKILRKHEPYGSCLIHSIPSLLTKCNVLMEHGARIGLMEFCIFLSLPHWEKFVQLSLSHPDCLTLSMQKNLSCFAQSTRSNDEGVLHSLLPAIVRTARMDASAEVGIGLLCILLFAIYLRKFDAAMNICFRGLEAMEIAKALFEGTTYMNLLVPISDFPPRIVPFMFRSIEHESSVCIAPIHLLLGDIRQWEQLRPSTLRLDILRAFVDMGADVNLACTVDGQSTWTALHLICATKDCLLEAEYLIEAGANVNATFTNVQNNRNFVATRTAIQAAAFKGDLPVVELLIAKGADVNLPGEEMGGGTSLQLVVAQGYFRIMQVLVEAGAELDVDRRDGRTIFDIAAENGRLDCLKYLLDRWTGRMSISEACKKAAVSAQREHHFAIAKYLREYRC